MRTSRIVEESAVLVDGPWTHRDVAANGIRLHIAEAGDGPLVVLLHGFGEFWWAWRHQIDALAGAGFRAVAPDLRGYGASDKPPRGYDAMTLADDIDGLIRALGERRAIVVGHGWGGVLAWTLAATRASIVDRIAVLSTPHPLCWPAALRNPRQRRALAHVGRFQLPWHPERWLVDDDATNAGALMRRWAMPPFPDRAAERLYRESMLILSVPHCALEYYRWAVRSIPRADGRRYRTAMRTPIAVPTLQIHGARDKYVLVESAQRSITWVSADYEWHVLDGIGHYPHEEAPDDVTKLLVQWCTQ